MHVSLRTSCFLLALAGVVAAAEPIDFEREIRPLLKERCGECHGAKVQKSSLRLDVRHAAFKGGDNGPALVANKSGESELIRRIVSADADERMPPKGPPLTDAQIGLLKRWIDAGAVWPETDEDRAAAKDKRLEHWAWQPIREILPPYQPDVQASESEIDAFVRAKLQEHRLQPAPEADRRIMLRRLSFDLLGLPPSPEAIAEFVADERPDAYERLVDRLLASPRYGERWAQHWLDIAHYADTHGFERDQRRDHAWRYRDWVVAALNRDLPYDQFLRDQIAGDALRPDDREAVIAGGFLAAGPWDFVGQAETPSPVLKRLARADDLDDMVTQVMTATCGVTINCARCHDHKLDPISQREYYALWAVFAGVKRGNRAVSPAEDARVAARKKELETKLNEVRGRITRARGAVDLADIIGGGDGGGSGKPSGGIDPLSGNVKNDKRGFIAGVTVNKFAKTQNPLIDGVVIPDGGDSGEVVISSTGLKARGIPKTSGKAWDAIRSGPVNSQHSTKLGDIDFATDGHTLLSLHANSAVTFNLDAIRKAANLEAVRFRASAGYFGQTPKDGASFRVLLDGETKVERASLGRDDGLVAIDLEIPISARFLTLLATDGGNDISHDQICFGDARLDSSQPADDAARKAELASLSQERVRLQNELASLPAAEQVYAVLSESPPPVKLLARGNPEQPKDDVSPGGLGCLTNLEAEFKNANSDAERRIALANWLTDPRHPLVRRVIVNRLWQHHFGAGLVETASDFGLAGSPPSHPELLDWLANELRDKGWSLKVVHRRICLSAAYRRSSQLPRDLAAEAAKIDASNRFLARQNPRRLDAESLRDSVLTISGNLNGRMFGPGYRDFDYQEEYAPVYKYVTADKPELWRRSVYRFIVRTTPHAWLTTLDCPNPANLTPSRNITTTALQSLALMNDDFLLRQADYSAERIAAEFPTDRPAQVTRAFELTLQRKPTAAEQAAAVGLIERQNLAQLCRWLLNANEFVYID